MPSARGTRRPGLCREPHTPRFTPSHGRGLLPLLNQLGREVRGGPLTCPRPQPAETTARGLVPGRLHFLHRLSGIRVRLGEPTAVRDSLATRGGQAVSVRSPHTSFEAYFCPFLGAGTVPTGVTPPTTAAVNPVSRPSSRRGRSVGPLPQGPVVCVFSVALFIFKSRSYFYFLFDLLLYGY